MMVSELCVCRKWTLCSGRSPSTRCSLRTWSTPGRWSTTGTVGIDGCISNTRIRDLLLSSLLLSQDSDWDSLKNKLQVCNRVCAENQALSKALDERLEQFHELRRENTGKRREDSGTDITANDLSTSKLVAQRSYITVCVCVCTSIKSAVCGAPGLAERSREKRLPEHPATVLPKQRWICTGGTVVGGMSGNIERSHGWLDKKLNKWVDG